MKETSKSAPSFLKLIPAGLLSRNPKSLNIIPGPWLLPLTVSLRVLLMNSKLASESQSNKKVKRRRGIATPNLIPCLDSLVRWIAQLKRWKSSRRIQEAPATQPYQMFIPEEKFIQEKCFLERDHKRNAKKRKKDPSIGWATSHRQRIDLPICYPRSKNQSLYSR